MTTETPTTGPWIIAKSEDGDLIGLCAFRERDCITVLWSRQAGAIEISAKLRELAAELEDR